MKGLEEYRELLLNALTEECGGQVYLSLTSIPAEYPCGSYEFKGFKPDGQTDMGIKGQLKFNLYLVEDVTDYGKHGDIYEAGSVNAVDGSEKVWARAEALSKRLKAERIGTENIEVYAMDGDAGRELVAARLEVVCKYRY
ncbi:MAG: hypothetical protein WC176_08895 [Candidatus Cloacimonadaceae bacterium]|jgi:hypothetical protein